MEEPFETALLRLCTAYLAAYEGKDAAGCAAGFTEDARIDHPFGPPARGRDEIAALHAGWVALGERDKRMDVLEAEAEGRLGTCLLRWSAEVDGPDGGATREGGVTLAVLRRGAAGWRFHRMALLPDA